MDKSCGKIVLMGVFVLLMLPLLAHADGDATPTPEVTAVPTEVPDATPAMEVTPTATPERACNDILDPVQRRRCLAESIVRPVGRIIAESAGQFGSCSKASPADRAVCLKGVRDNLTSAIQNAQAERKSIEDANLKALRAKFGDRIEAELSARKARLEAVVQAQRERFDELLGRFKSKGPDQLNASERGQYRRIVNQTVLGHLDSLDAYVDTLESEGVPQDKIDSMRANLAADRAAWLAANDSASRKAVVEQTNQQWSEFRNLVRAGLLASQVKLLVAQSTEALSKARLAIANLSEQGVNTTNLDAIADNIGVKVAALQDGSFTGPQIKLRAVQLYRVFVNLRNAISRAASNLDVPPLPKDLVSEEADGQSISAQ